MNKRKEIWKCMFFVSLIVLIVVFVVNGFDIILPFSSNMTMSYEEEIERVNFSFEKDYGFGTNPDASVHLVVFGDYQCPYSAKIVPVINQLRETHGEKINFVYKHMPNFQIHKQAVIAALAAECMRDQGRFWEFSQELFKQQNNLFYKNLLKIAEDMGLDDEQLEQYETCIISQKHKEKIASDLEDVMNLNLLGTPTVFINNLKFQGGYDYETYEEHVKSELESVKNHPSPLASLAIDG